MSPARDVEVFAVIYVVLVWLGLFGACVGSFLNVVVYRLPQGNFFAEARSYCPACKTKLRWFELVPVLSWLLLRSRCRTCGARISLRYPLVECAGAALAVVCALRAGGDFSRMGGEPWLLAAYFLLYFGVSAILLAVALIDYDTMLIPDALVLALVPFAAAALWVRPDISPLSRVIGLCCVSLPMLLLTLAIPNAFGGGDIKLMAVCGFLLGWQHTLLAFFLAVLSGGAYAAVLLARKKKNRHEQIAFGPYLCFGVAVAMFAAAPILQWYRSLFLW